MADPDQRGCTKRIGPRLVERNHCVIGPLAMVMDAFGTLFGTSDPAAGAQRVCSRRLRRGKVEMRFGLMLLPAQAAYWVNYRAAGLGRFQVAHGSKF